MTLVRSKISGKLHIATESRVKDTTRWELVKDTAKSSGAAEKGKQAPKAKAKAAKPAPAAIETTIEDAGDELDELVD